MKKLITIALTFVLTAAAMTGCGCTANVGGSANTQNTTAVTTQPTTQPTTAPTTHPTTTPTTAATQPSTYATMPATEHTRPNGTDHTDGLMGTDHTDATGDMNGNARSRGIRRG